MPSVNISGEVKIGEGVYVGTGAKIINQLEIGEYAIVSVGAGEGDEDSGINMG